MKKSVMGAKRYRPYVQVKAPPVGEVVAYNPTTHVFAGTASRDETLIQAAMPHTQNMYHVITAGVVVMTTIQKRELDGLAQQRVLITESPTASLNFLQQAGIVDANGALQAEFVITP